MFKNRSITRKLMTVILVTSGTVLTLACGTLLVYELVTFRQSMVQSLSTLARAIAANSTAALAFQNVDDATQVLSALAADPHVVGAALYDGKGAMLASYVNPTAERVPLPSKPDVDGYRFGGSSLALYEPVIVENRRLGTLYLQSDLVAMFERFTLYIGMVLGVIAAAGVVAFVLATRLQRHITQPVLALARTAQAVSEQQNYALRAERFDDDEMGQLTDAFNVMLAKVQQVNITLERRVLERTAELEASNRELDAFAYSVSHDLRAPLRAVDGFSRIVLEEYAPALPEQARHYLEIARSSALNMGKLIDGLLAFSRLGRQAVRKEPVATDVLVREVLADLRSDIEGRGVEITVGELPPCQADPLLLKQVFVNLLSNALKYTRLRTDATVVVGTVEGNVYFVRDNGVGFDMRYQDKLFGVFQRLHGVDAFEGIGVGLALVQRIVHRHGGRIWAHAEVDRGATFYFTLSQGDHS